MNTLSSERIAEQLRRVAARATHEIVLRRGKDLGVWVGCGFPKSGTVWLCQLMSSYLDSPYPRDYQMPVMMRSVIHAHWKYDERLPPTVYIVRDGRDVMISLYFHHVRLLTIPRNPRRSKQLRETFTRLYGPNFSPENVRDNLPRFIEFEMTERDGLRGFNWSEHVQDWQNRKGVATVRYEDLLSDAASHLHRALVELEAPVQDKVFAELAAQRFEFKRASGRTAGAEDRSSFLRKGVAGDWRTHFTPEAAEAFDHFAGQTLIELAYEKDRTWTTNF